MKNFKNRQMILSHKQKITPKSFLGFYFKPKKLILINFNFYIDLELLLRVTFFKNKIFLGMNLIQSLSNLT